ncbi:MAG: hypothetical protein JXA74_15910 [Anaerolineae bacterium]|nr:hypothetical protein [Anaerolineae bacterium]
MLWLEYDTDINHAREARWWTAFGGSSVYLPMSQVDSGQQIASGYEDFAARYRGMVSAALARPAEAELVATGQRVDDGLRLSVQLTNRSGVALGSANDATLWVIVSEEHAGPGEGRLTGRVVRHNEAWKIASLAPDATATYTLDTMPLSGVDWTHVRAVVLADYRPGGSVGPYDMLQAARASLSP